MMRNTLFLLAAAASAAIAPPAVAGYVEVDFSGTIAETTPDADAGLVAGTPIHFSAVFDPGKLVDHTGSINDATGLGFASVLTASLSDDPLASLSISVGSVSWNKYDQPGYHTPGGAEGGDLGGGNFPIVTYLDGQFAGVGNSFINKQGYTIDADPIADAFGGFGVDPAKAGGLGYDFIIAKAGSDDEFADPLAFGNFDARSATFTPVATPVPEPASWALMIGGVGLAGGALRRRERAAETAVA